MRSSHEIEAVLQLRVELLRAVTGYGLVLAAAGEAGHDRAGWLEWFDWCERMLQRSVQGDARAAELAETGSTPQIAAAREMLSSTAVHPLPVEALIGVREKLAAAARAVESVGLEPLAEFGDRPSPRGRRVLWALEDSLALVDAPTVEFRAAGVTAESLLSLAIAAREEGVWQLWDFDFDAV